ncbi:MAG: VOC family protein [Oscillospiraceae bacterium]|nr:VOC family protein [Oscillospiraceae bacterium]
MHLGSIYLIANDFKKSIIFYEKLLDMSVTSENKDRFAQFVFEGHNIAILNGHFDTKYPDKIVYKGECTNFFDGAQDKALALNTHKFVFNFWDEDLRAEYKRISGLNITENLSKIKYFCYVSPYYYFHLTDPDDNIIEVTGNYTPEKGEFD